MRVGEPALAERLQQQVEDVGVRLLDLVEEEHAERLLADAARELRPRARALQAEPISSRTASPLRELAHVEADQAVAARRTGTRRAPSRARSCRRPSGRRRTASRAACVGSWRPALRTVIRSTTASTASGWPSSRCSANARTVAGAAALVGQQQPRQAAAAGERVDQSSRSTAGAGRRPRLLRHVSSSSRTALPGTPVGLEAAGEVDRGAAGAGLDPQLVPCSSRVRRRPGSRAASSASASGTSIRWNASAKPGSSRGPGQELVGVHSQMSEISPLSTNGAGARPDVVVAPAPAPRVDDPDRVAHRTKIRGRCGPVDQAAGVALPHAGVGRPRDRARSPISRTAAALQRPGTRPS